MARSLVFWLLLMSGVYLIVVLGRDLWQVLTADRRVESAVRKVEELAGRREELRKELEWVETDEFVEREAREKLMLSRPGEKTVMLPKVASGSMALRQEEETEPERLEPWQQWWKLFVY